MIPANIDYVSIFNDLNKLGISDYKIEAMCGLAEGHISHLRAGRRQQMAYQRAARVYNLWFEEVMEVAEPDDCQGALVTT
jgi:hypothetical protein